MAYLSDEYKKLSQDDKVAGVVTTFHDFGFDTLVPAMPFTATDGNQHEWTIEKERGTGRVTHSPNATDVEVTSRTYENISVPTRMLSVDAQTSIYDQSVRSDLVSQHDTREYEAAKDLTFEFGEQLIHGGGFGKNQHGMDYYLSRYGGYVANDGTVSRMDGLSADAPLFEGRQIWYTNDFTADTGTGTPSSAAKALDPEILDDLVTRDDGTGFDYLVMNRTSRNWIKALMRAGSGGLTPEYIMDENFGRKMLAFDGVPIIWTRTAGLKKEGLAGTYGASVSSKVLTVETPADEQDDDWIGFTSLDVGREVTLDNGTDAAETKTIAKVTSARKVELNEAPTATYSNADFSVAPINAIYAVKFGEVDGFSCVNANVDDLGSDASASAGYSDVSAISGFVAKYVGRQQTQGRFIRTQMDFIGTFKAGSIWSLARLTGYKAPDV